MRVYGMKDTVNYEPYSGCVVEDLVNEPGAIFSLIKYHKLNFSDEVLKEAHITKTIRDIRYNM